VGSGDVRRGHRLHGSTPDGAHHHRRAGRDNVRPIVEARDGELGELVGRDREIRREVLVGPGDGVERDREVHQVDGAGRGGGGTRSGGGGGGRTEREGYEPGEEGAYTDRERYESEPRLVAHGES